MKSPKPPGGNLRDFHIDERLPEVDPMGPPVRPTQTLSMRQSPVPPPMPAPTQWSVGQSTYSNSNLTESRSGDDLWSSWEAEVSPRSSEETSASTPRTTTSVSTSAPTPAAVPENESRTGTVRGEGIGNPWSADLAFEERRMERAGTVDCTNQYQKQDILRARTREFTALLQKLFREHVDIFNEARHSPAHHIHVYKVSKTEEDFMLYRNGVKLAVSGQRSGRILFAFNQYLGQLFAPTQSPVVEIEAHWGPFDQLFWSYKGERLQILDVVRYFMTEFVRQSFR